MSRRRKPPARVSLDGPLPGATTQAFVRFWRRYAWFSGRASRRELWWVVVAWLLVATALGALKLAISGSYAAYLAAPALGAASMPYNLWVLATLVPSLALGARRLHDTDRSGWWLLLLAVPLVGWIPLVVFWAGRPDPAGARFDRRFR